MSDHDPELAARLRAAFAYADLTKGDRAKLLGVSERQITRLETGAARIDPSYIDAVVQGTRVPEWFFDTGWEAAPEPEEPALLEKFEAMQRRFDALEKTMRADALAVLEQALPDLVPGLRQVLAEAPSPANVRGLRRPASGGDGA